MKSNIFIPKKCKVGFNERSDTYTGVLGYVIYNDGKVWRKESSWESWREKFMTLLNYEDHSYRNYKESSNEKIKVLEFDNEPLDGFVINKKAGGTKYGWNPRQTYCRIYDPRGFEFEITIPNLLYILENTNSIKGKGLEGKFIYGWDKKDLILIPEDSPEYEEMVKFTELQDGKVLKKDMIKGNVYLNSQGERLTYLGDAYELDYYGYIKGDKKKLWFARKGGFINYTAASSLKADLNEVDSLFSNLINKIEKEEKHYYSGNIEYELIKDIEAYIKSFNNGSRHYYTRGIFKKTQHGMVPFQIQHRPRRGYFSSGSNDDFFQVSFGKHTEEFDSIKKITENHKELWQLKTTKSS